MASTLREQGRRQTTTPDETDAGRRVGADAEEAATEEGFAGARARAKTTDGDDDEAEAIHAARARLGEDKS